MNVQFYLGLIAGCLGLIAFYPYVISILRRETIPSTTTWAIAFFVDWFLMKSYIDSGAENSMFIPIAFATGVTILFALSLKYGTWKNPSKIEIVSGMIALCALISIPIFSYRPELIVWLIVIALVLGATPTLEKAITKPATENRTAWYIWGIASVLNFFSVEGLFDSESIQLEILAYPVYVVYFDAGMMVILFFKSKTSS